MCISDLGFLYNENKGNTNPQRQKKQLIVIRAPWNLNGAHENYN